MWSILLILFGMWQQLCGLSRLLLQLLVTFSMLVFVVSVAETGDDILDCIDSECLLLVNHQSTVDVPVIIQALTDANKRHLSRHVCWILDDMFKYANFGLPCRVHGDFFILQVQFFHVICFILFGGCIACIASQHYLVPVPSQDKLRGL